MNDQWFEDVLQHVVENGELPTPRNDDEASMLADNAEKIIHEAHLIKSYV